MAFHPGIIGATSLVFPATFATYDLDFANSQFFGGTQPDDGTNSSDGRFFKAEIVNAQPNYIEKADGSLRSFTTTSRVRFSTGGLWMDGQDRTNRVLRNRDLTNAVWVKTNCTALKDQTGRTNVANSASKLTATADSATCLQSITLSSLTLKGYVEAKRITGSGTLEMTMDNGSTWTNIPLDAPIYNGIGRYSIAAQTLANPTVGFRLGTSGDSFLIDFVELSDNMPEYSPIATTTAAVKGWRDRNSAYDTDNTPLIPYLRDRSIRIIFMEYAQRQNGGLITASTGTIIQSSSTGVQVFSAAATSGNVPTFATSPRLTELNRVMAWQTPTETGVCLNGGDIVRASGAAPNGAMDHFDIGTNGSGSARIDGRITRTIFFNSLPSDTTIKEWTT